MRISRLSFLALCPAWLAAAGCDVSAPGNSTSGSTSVYKPAASVDAGDASVLGNIEADAETADAAAAPLQQSNMLCVLTTTCDPDLADTASSCHVAPDGGAYDPSGGYDGGTLACRVQPSPSVSSDGLGMSTSCSVAGPGTAGDACTSPTDCAARFDCVGQGSCRQYCCAGNTQCSAEEFCDIQPLAAATTTKVPVCMPIEPPGGCDLSSALGSPVANGIVTCPTGQTCAIVREDGSTGCVEAGGQTAGEACNTDHCAAGLVCLGALNARLCYALCATSASGACPAPMTCQGGLPLFQDPKVGVCR
jgi:hypothetical protein